MRKTYIYILVMLAFALKSNAQATRTWVSGVGDDANPCSRTAPCKTFAGAISKTAAGGEISVLDPGGFGAVTITKSITINANGFLAGVLVSGTNGIVVSALATDVITLRGLTLQGLGTGLDGIKVLTGNLNVEDCKIQSFTQNGIEMALTADGQYLTVKNSIISNCTIGGIAISTTTGRINTTIFNTNVQTTGIGININTVSGVTGNVSVNNCVLSNNTTGIEAQGTGTQTLNAENCMISNNATGVISANSGSTVRLSNCSIYDNTTAGVSGIGRIISFGNNQFAGNATNGILSVLSSQ